MIVITPADNALGVGFNHRRQSRDRILNQKTLEISAGNPLWLHPNSVFLFPDNEWICIDDDPLDQAEEQDYCFAEAQNLAPWKDKIEQLILMRWNRDYPADTYLGLDLKHDFELTGSEEFAGFSHDVITMETYMPKAALKAKAETGTEADGTETEGALAKPDKLRNEEMTDRKLTGMEQTQRELTGRELSGKEQTAAWQISRKEEQQ